MAMTQAQTRANGLVIPSLPQLWLTAMLRVLVELVLGVASTCRMRNLRQPRDWHTGPTTAALPEETSDTHQETEPVAASGHTSPSPSVLLTTSAIHLRLLRRWRARLRGTSSTAEGGGGGSPHLRGETEGAARAMRKSRYPYLFVGALT